MDKYLKGEIVEGKGVGQFYFGLSLEEIKKYIDFEYQIGNTEYGMRVADLNFNIQLFFTDKNRLQHITLLKNYKGKFLDKIGIGDKLSDFKKIVRYETNEFDSEGFYYFPDYKGIRVLLENWSLGDVSPIWCIEVYDSVLGPVEDYV